MLGVEVSNVPLQGGVEIMKPGLYWWYVKGNGGDGADALDGEWQIIEVIPSDGVSGAYALCVTGTKWRASLKSAESYGVFGPKIEPPK